MTDQHPPPTPDWIVTVFGRGDSVSIGCTDAMTLDIATRVIVALCKLLLDSNLAGPEGSEKVRAVLTEIVQLGCKIDGPDGPGTGLPH